MQSRVENGYFAEYASDHLPTIADVFVKNTQEKGE
jgi:hypothetical protein